MKREREREREKKRRISNETRRTRHWHSIDREFMKESNCGLDEYRQRYIHVKNELSQGLHFLVHRVLKFKSAELDFVYSFVPSFILYTCTILCIHHKYKKKKNKMYEHNKEGGKMFDVRFQHERVE